MTTLRAFVVAGLLLAAVPAGAVTISCGQEFSTANTTIDVDNSISGCTGHGLKISASGITLNCQGHGIQGDQTAGHYGILVSKSGGGALQNVTIRNCEVSYFNRGIRTVQLEGGAIEDNTIDHSQCSSGCGVGTSDSPYGLDITSGSKDLVIARNVVLNSADEGIHISGKTPTCAKSDNDPGGHLLENNHVSGSGTEGVYILCSDHNRLVDNDMMDNHEISGNEIGLFIDEWSTENVILGNHFVNDPIAVKRASNRNSFVGNVLTENTTADGPNARIKFTGSSSNFIGSTSINGAGATAALYVYEKDVVPMPSPSPAVTLQSECNQAISSAGIDPDDYHIDALDASKNNRFLRFDFSPTPLACHVVSPSTVEVSNLAGSAVSCGGSGAVVPGDCTWWYFADLCDVGHEQENAPTVALASTTISDVRYFRANTGAIETGPSVTVASTGCVHLSAKTQVVLGPGTTIEGRLQAVVQ